MDDTISRAAVRLIQSAGNAYPEEWNQDYERGFEDAINAVLALPSAQPEIIRCKDCRWGKEVCGNIECFADINVPPEYHGYDWFCPNGERRTDG